MDKTFPEKLITKLIDWLLYNWPEIRAEINATDYSPGGMCSGYPIHSSYDLDSALERYVTSQDYHRTIVRTVELAVLTLGINMQLIYAAKYERKLEYRDIAQKEGISEKTVQRSVATIRARIREDVEQAEIAWNSVMELRQKYWYIGRKERVSSKKTLG